MTDRAKNPRKERIREVIRGADLHHERGSRFAPERLDAMSMTQRAVCSLLIVDAHGAGGSHPTNRNDEAILQAAPLATWEDEGGATAFAR